MTYDLICIGLEDALKQPGCPVCRLGRSAAASYLDHLFYESVNDVSTRLLLDASNGFCSEHADEAARLGDVLGAGIIYEDLVARLGDVLGAGIIYEDLVRSTLAKLSRWLATAPRRTSRRWRRWAQGAAGTRLAAATRRTDALSLRPSGPCPACTSRDAAEERSMWGLLKYMEELRQALQASDGLCLPHLAGCLEQEGLEAEKAELVAMEKVKLEALQADLQELIRKFDYRFSHEPKGREAGSWRQAMAKISGTKHLNQGEARR
ncbi:MAG: DUF6062 family protein [Firmicutes bacterium]|nr:DUF6062 family protein [Bacillota bacterium]